MRTSGTLLSLLAASAASAIFIPNDFSVFDTLTKDSDDTTAPIPLFVNEAPLLSTSTHQDDIIKDSYIVVFHPHVHHHEAKEHHAWVQDLHVMQQQSKHDNLEKRGLLGDMVKQIPLLGGDHHAAKDVMDSVLGGIKHTYNLADGKLKGYAGTFDDHTISQVRKHPSVEILLCAYSIIYSLIYRWHMSNATNKSTHSNNNETLPGVSRGSPTPTPSLSPPLTNTSTTHVAARVLPPTSSTRASISTTRISKGVRIGVKRSPLATTILMETDTARMSQERLPVRRMVLPNTPRLWL